MSDRAATRPAGLADVEAMAALAEAKRERYRDHAAPFQRPAHGARDVHAPFLAALTERTDFVVLVHDEGHEIDGFLVGRLGGAPPPFGGRDDVVHVDDFAIADSRAWPSTGSALLREAAKRARALGAATLVAVSGPPAVDAPKVEFLADSGLRVEAEWWVGRIEPSVGEPAATGGFRVVVAPAPPVYDPGGPVCMALELDDAAALGRVERFAAQAGAVLLVVPVEASRAELRDVLGRSGYVVASEWYAAALS